METETAETQSSSKFINEEDENVNLLFQEDGEDGEFMESEEESEEEEGDEEEESPEAGDEAQAQETGDDPMKELESDSEPVNSDDVLSDSDMSVSDSDEEEGEKELEKEERRKKRQKSQQSKLIPKIKKFKPNDVVKKASKPKKMVSSESLMQNLRRASSRASAIENKEALVKKLQDDEARRATITPVVREKERELTQEEKLAEAVETEKANVLSLELFQQQEVVKKERQKHLLQSKRAKMSKVIRLTSQEQFITPTEEIETARSLYTLITSRSKKRNIKRLKALLDMDLDKYPGEIDKELPYVKEHGIQEVNGEKDGEEIEVDGEEIEVNGKTEDELTGDDEATVESEAKSNGEAPADHDQLNEIETDKVDNKTETEENNTNENSETMGTTETTNVESNDLEPKSTENDPDAEVLSETQKEETPIEKKQKKVTFADDVVDPAEQNEQNEQHEQNEEEVQVSDSTPEPVEDSGPKEIFEGPVQRVCRNLVYLLEFGDNPYTLNEFTIKNVLFGEDSNLTASRRFKDLKTILKVGKNNNPYTKSKNDIDEMFTPATDLTEENSMFEELNRLPKLGVRQEIIEEAVEEDDNDQDLVLTTEAPLGLYLPNGNKKICLITGNEVKYFDPSLGVPYSDVETFKFLKSVEQGHIPWFSVDGSYNDTGATEIYLGSKDGSTRSARGVPAGFDN